MKGWWCDDDGACACTRQVAESCRETAAVNFYYCGCWSRPSDPCGPGLCGQV